MRTCSSGPPGEEVLSSASAQVTPAAVVPDCQLSLLFWPRPGLDSVNVRTCQPLLTARLRQSAARRVPGTAREPGTHVPRGESAAVFAKAFLAAVGLLRPEPVS
jgi:hypothetical protein